MPSFRGGGAERVMVTLANALAERGYTVDLVVSHATGPYQQEVSPSVKVHDLKSPRVAGSLRPLVGYLRRRKPEVLLATHTRANGIASIAKTLSRWKGRLYLREANVIQTEKLNGNWKEGIALRLARWAYRRADKVVAVSRAVADDLQASLRLSPEHIAIAYNPVVTESLRRLEKEAPAVDWPVAERETKRILAAGRLTRAKGFDTLLAAFARLRDSHSAQLMILGEGEDRDALLAQAEALGVSRWVSLPGFQANPYAVMRSADLFVLPSRWEGLPNTLIQAMACETPVISSNCPGGSAEILEEGRWGQLVPVDDPTALANAMAFALDADSQPDVKQRAEAFSEDNAVRGYINLMALTDTAST
jgi:glycosyltransferase involved in cell wall biosynthesis